MKLNSKRIYERKNNEMQEQKKNRLSAYRERIFEIMDSLEEITDELDELQEEMEDDIIDPADLIPPLFPPLDENGEEIREDSVPPMNVTICVMPEGKNFTLPIEMIRRMLDEH